MNPTTRSVTPYNQIPHSVKHLTGTKRKKAEEDSDSLSECTKAPTPSAKVQRRESVLTTLLKDEESHNFTLDCSDGTVTAHFSLLKHIPVLENATKDLMGDEKYRVNLQNYSKEVVQLFIERQYGLTKDLSDEPRLLVELYRLSDFLSDIEITNSCLKELEKISTKSPKLLANCLEGNIHPKLSFLIERSVWVIDDVLKHLNNNRLNSDNVFPLAIHPLVDTRVQLAILTQNFQSEELEVVFDFWLNQFEPDQWLTIQNVLRECKENNDLEVKTEFLDSAIVNVQEKIQNFILELDKKGIISSIECMFTKKEISKLILKSQVKLVFSPAETLMLNMYAERDLESSLIERVKNTANEGDALSQYAIGCAILDKKIKEDTSKAKEMFALATKQNIVEAMYQLGIMYEGGRGAEQSDKKAVQWYKLAAELGFSRAQNNLGTMFEDGRGVKQSDEEAIKWYNLAAKQENAIARYNLGYMHKMGKGVKQSDKEAVKWFRLAAEQRYAKAQHCLGVMYKKGDGVEKSYEEAFKWIKLAANQEDSDGQYYLGIFYACGVGVEKNFSEALRLIHLSADQGNHRANDVLKSLRDTYEHLFPNDSHLFIDKSFENNVINSLRNTRHLFIDESFEDTPF